MTRAVDVIFIVTRHHTRPDFSCPALEMAKVAGPTIAACESLPSRCPERV
jgi:hypothetical protein